MYVAREGAASIVQYRVLERGNKAWKVQVGKRVEINSRDRLKR